MTLDIEWTGKSYSDQIDSLSGALNLTEHYIRQIANCDLQCLYKKTLAEADNGDDKGPASLLWLNAESFFAEIAFSEWHTMPDNWSLICH